MTTLVEQVLSKFFNHIMIS